MQNTLIKHSSNWRIIAEICSEIALNEIPYQDALKLNILPVVINHYGNEKELLIATTQRSDYLDLISELKLITTLPIKTTEINCDSLKKSISAAYSKIHQEKALARKEIDEQNKKQDKVVNIADFEISIEKKIPDLLKSIIRNAFTNKASDIHLKSTSDSTCEIKYRIGGRLQNIEHANCSNLELEYLTRHIKILCNLDTTEHKKDQEGSFEFSFHELTVRIRCSIIPTIFGNKIALRILHNYLLEEINISSKFNPKDLGLNTAQTEEIKNKILSKSGILLISGPTGSGKSTLLYSIIESFAPKHWNILSLEDPVERIIPSITQIEVKSEVKENYQKAFKAMLRQDPDMLCISEIRDSSVLLTAIQAALSGIFVISTIHAPNSFELLLRLFELGATPISLGSTLKFISSQRLIPKNCVYCSSIEKVDIITKDTFLLPEETLVSVAKGCKKCSYTKYDSLVACHETLSPNIDLIYQIYKTYKEGIKEENILKIQEFFNKTHYQSFKSSLRNLILQRVISPEVALQFLI